MVTLGKPQRQHRILRVLEDPPVSSQAQPHYLNTNRASN